MASSTATTLSSPKLHFHGISHHQSQTLNLHFRLRISPRAIRAARARRLPNDYSQVLSLPLLSISPSTSVGKTPFLRFDSHKFTHRPTHEHDRFIFVSDFDQDASGGGGEGLIASPRNWSGRNIGGFVVDEVDDEDEEEEEESDDRSLDLLVRFLQNVFKKVSRRARKAVRSVLPVSIPSKLVGFSVNGVIILTFLWVLKAFLEVVCTLGSVVFVSILLIRGVWSGITYMQESHNRRASLFDDEHSAWRGAQPVG